MRALKSLVESSDFDSAIRRFDSSRPSQAAYQLEIVCAKMAESPQNTGFFEFAAVSLDSKNPQLSRENPEGLQPILKYSHFRETFGGDFFRSALRRKAAGVL